MWEIPPSVGNAEMRAYLMIFRDACVSKIFPKKNQLYTTKSRTGLSRNYRVCRAMLEI